MARGAPSSTAKPIKFKKRFRPKTVQIDGKDEATYVFETAPVTRSIERELKDAFETIEDEHADDDDVMFQVIGALIDKLAVPTEGKEKPASEVLRDLWEDDKIEFADVTDFLGDITSQRRPT